MNAGNGLERDGQSRRFDVTLAGDTDLDVLFYGLPEELPLERELLANGMAVRLGGSAAITAHNLAALGNRVGFVTADAGDDFGRLCHADLTRAGVDLSTCVPVTGMQTGVTVHLQHEQRRHMLTYAGATASLDFDNLDLKYLGDSRHFHMSSYYLQRALTPRIPELFSRLKDAGVTLSLDPNDDPDHTWGKGILEAVRQVDVLMPNEREACLMTGKVKIEDAIEMLREMVPVLVIKRGACGASAYGVSHCWHVAADKVRSVDAIGAGDSFNAGFLHAWLGGWPIEKALSFANLAAAWSTTQPGGTSAFRSEKDLRALSERWAELESVGIGASQS